MPLRVPSYVLNDIRGYLRHSGNSAHADYSDAEGSEDALTGSFGGRLKRKLSKKRSLRGWSWRVTWRKMRSASGRSAEERLTGADGIVQIEVFHADNNVFTKGLLFQAKKAGDDDFKRLERQCTDMEKLAPKGNAVFVYGEAGYRGMASTDWDRASRSLAGGTSIGDFLADDFLECSVGQEGLFYEREQGTLVVPPTAAQSAVRRIRTELNKLGIEVYEPATTVLPSA